MEYTVINSEHIDHGPNREHFLSARGTIGEDEFLRFRQQCHILERYTSIRSLLYTAAKNGNDLFRYLDPIELYKKYCITKPSTKKMVREANRLALNFASALRTLVEISTNEIKGKAAEKAKYEAFQSNVFDNVQGYRFWIRLRNYLIHRKMLYEGCSVMADSVILSVSSRSLLEWHGWNSKQREDIELLDRGNCFTTVLPAIFAAFFLIGEWAVIQQEEFKKASSFLSGFMKHYGITGELYIAIKEDGTLDGDKSLHLYYPPTYEIQNISSLIDWRNYIARNGELSIFEKLETLERLIPHFDGPFD